MGGDSAEDAAPADDGERGGSSSADEASSARPTPESTSAGGGVADATHARSPNLGNGDVDVARGGAAGASDGETLSENPAPPQPITIPGRSGHHRGRHRRGKSRGGSGSGSGWGSYGGGSGDGFGRFGWGSATIDEWVMNGWPPSQSNTPRTGSFSAPPGYDFFAASPRAGSFSAGSAPGPAGASPRGFAWWTQQQQQPTSPVQDRAGRLSRGSIVFDPDDFVPSPRQSRANSRGFPASSATLTVYVREIPSGASEGDVHDHFYTCGAVRECRVSADPHHSSQSTRDRGGGKKRVAFVAFETENAVREALTMDGSLLLGEPIRVMPSRTEVMPVDPGLLPRTEEERERCARTVYVSNVDPDVRSQDLRLALERFADGKIAALHLQARKNDKGKTPRRETNAADAGQKKATSVAFAEFCDVDAAVRAIDATGRLKVGSFPVRVAASKTPLKPPKKSHRSRFALARSEVSSTMSAATAASTGVTSTTNESGDTGDTEMIHEDEDEDEDEDEEDAYAYEDGSLDDAIREGGTRNVPDDDRGGDETYEVDVVEDDAPSASPPNGSETTTTTTTTTDSDSPVSVAPNDETEATTTKMGKLTVGGGDAEVIPLVDETEFPPLGR